jgi:hypothetical protein
MIDLTDGHTTGAGPDTAEERNGKVLHARIPGSLDREIKRRARSLGISVSTVVRNVLLHTFDLVEDVVSDGAEIALSLAGERSTRDGGDDTSNTRQRRARSARPADGAGSRPAPRGGVVAWQPAVLNLNAVCGHCNAILRKGVSAAIGIRDGDGPHEILCTACLDELRGDADPSSAEAPER